VSGPTFEDAAVAALDAYGRKMMHRIQGILFTAQSSNSERAAAIAALAPKLASFAARGSRLGVDSVISQAASEAQDLKLDLEKSGKAALEVVGAALLDAASYFLPIMTDVLVKKIFPEPPLEGREP
jgi:N-acetylglucosamine kinase-like BadF-type ATPase